MFINPKAAIEKGWIKGIKDEVKQVQPNAIDFTLDSVMVLDQSDVPFVGEGSKKMRHVFLMNPIENVWHLDGLCVYDGSSDVYVEVPEGVAAILYTRSTFARNGVFIMSGLYDSGFKGHIGFTIYTIGGSIEIEQGTRIGQIAFIHSENVGMYAGGYNHERANYWVDRAGGELHTGKVEIIEQPVAAGGDKGEFAKELEKTHSFDSLQESKPAGSKTFI